MQNYSVLVIQASLSQLVSLSFVIVLGVHVPTFSTIVTHITIVMQFFLSHTRSGFSLFLPMLYNSIAIPVHGKDKKNEQPHPVRRSICDVIVMLK